ncbi:hypothetical protein [Falsiroseomonas sp. CW058]|uniref:hypothetical protein n=1 Tax=Falsiroseomonas sp. CW058 TaxID=3388664 RepID=UPI003D318601
MPLLTAEDLRPHSRLAWACLVALLGVAAWLAVLERTDAAIGTLGALVGCLALVLPPRERMGALPWRLRSLPRRCDAAPILATLTSCPGYGLGWFYGDNLYDEAVHLLNGTLAGAVLAALLLADARPRTGREMAWAALGGGMVLAVGWEVFEWATGLIGDAVDTVTDILLTAGGVVAGAAFTASRQSGQLPGRMAGR